MNDFGIPALSMAMSAANVQQATSTAMLKKAMDFEEQTSSILIQTLAELPVAPGSNNIDVSI